MTSASRGLASRQALSAPPVPPSDRIALFADLDGTLAPIEATPDAVGPDSDRRLLIDALSAALHGRFAVVSGRTLADIDRVLEGRVVSVSGVHGLERRDSTGHVTGVAASPSLMRAQGAIHKFAKTRKGLIVEYKARLAAALHYRASPSEGADCRKLMRDLARQHGFRIQEGDMVVEIKVRGPDKGDAVRAFMAEPPFLGHMPVYVGDDLTDERGFEAASCLGGFGIVVGARRPTSAQYALADVAAVRIWLHRALALGEPA